MSRRPLAALARYLTTRSPSMQVDTVLCTLPLSDESLDKIRSTFPTVHYYPDKTAAIPPPVLASTQLLYTSGMGLHPSVKTFDDLPKVVHVQATSAGINRILHSPLFDAHLAGQTATDRQISLAGASGVHVLSIPNHVVAHIVGLYHQLHVQWVHAKTRAKWATGAEIDQSGKGYYARKTIGKTVGFLGYGALGRETARLCKAHGMRVVAANTSGKKTVDNSYILPGTGDRLGDIPERYYSATKELEPFLKECNVLVSSLPDTPQTRYFLDADKLALLKPDALFINVGRGTLIRSEEILKALDAPNGLFGAALDVTDPEPLPDNHPLWTHPKCIVTCHLSGDAEGEFEVATDILIENAKRLRAGEPLCNAVNFDKGY